MFAPPADTMKQPGVLIAATDGSLGGVLLKSSKCVRLNFCCTATNITATLAASMALSADTDNDTREAPATNATAGRT